VPLFAVAGGNHLGSSAAAAQRASGSLGLGVSSHPRWGLSLCLRIHDAGGAGLLMEMIYIPKE
jgi:hypothetical protein